MTTKRKQFSISVECLLEMLKKYVGEDITDGYLQGIELDLPHNVVSLYMVGIGEDTVEGVESSGLGTYMTYMIPKENLML